jgi:hypothetical protein
MKKMICLLFTVTLLTSGCISQYISFPDKFEITEKTVSNADTNSVDMGLTGSTNFYYKAKGGIIISMGIYSVKNVNPTTSATIPLK